MTMRLLAGFFTLLLVSACATSHPGPRFYAKTLTKEIENSPVFAKSLTGFTLLDPETGRTLCDVQGGHYFTPASTLKILTMATCLAVLGDSVPGMHVSKSNNCIYFRG
ncbi:MAG: D-alanyl-D-alanine carboxypeptidase, partial [Saprospiraceae bacterium]